MDALARAHALDAYAAETAGCVRCPLAETRSRVVFGSGNLDAGLMLVGEGPGFQEDQGGEPYAGQAGALLEQLLAGIGLRRDEVYLTTVLKCRPPQNRDPLELEIASCEPHLVRQVELVRPRVVATLGNFATRLLSGRSHGITRVHGQEQEVVLGSTTVVLFPLYHPAAALYTPSMLRELRDDFSRLPALLGQGLSGGVSGAPVAQAVHAVHAASAVLAAPAASAVLAAPATEIPTVAAEDAVAVGATQLGLF
ncbi:MAG: uracil-DNA glycosylase [Thermoleophilia bacterium]|nr:uracil-DNA glycosylase [Thermoleophilia bacterium]